MELLAVHTGINLVFIRWDGYVNRWRARARIVNPNKKITFVISRPGKEQDYCSTGYLVEGQKWDEHKLEKGLNIIKADSSVNLHKY